MTEQMSKQEWDEWINNEALWWMFANIPYRAITMKQLKRWLK